VLNPYQFDVLVMENMFGDILSDLMAGLVGGLGLAPGANIGTDTAIFEPVHGSAPDIAGKGIANPGAMLLAACMMLEHIGEADAGNRIRAALQHTVSERRTLTPDLGGTASTNDFAHAVIAHLS
jgi:isocitrate dehydrogenase (NAD+)